MLDVRSPLILAIPFVGLAVGAAAWSVLGGTTGAEAMGALEARLAKSGTALRVEQRSAGDAAARAVLSPLFPVVTPQSDPVIQLQGLTRSPRRQAALLAIGGKPAEWVELGATHADVTVVAITAFKVVLETPAGRKELGFWDKPAGAAQTPDAGDVPAGVRLPPAPASAPGG